MSSMFRMKYFRTLEIYSNATIETNRLHQINQHVFGINCNIVTTYQ